MTKLLRRYQCETCDEVYDTLLKAKECERRPTPKPKYKIGDKLFITSGEGKGMHAVVTRSFYYGPSWHGEDYAHKVGYNADLIGTWGSRQLVEGESCE